MSIFSKFFSAPNTRLEEQIFYRPKEEGQEILEQICAHLDLQIKLIDGDDCFLWESSLKESYPLSYFDLLTITGNPIALQHLNIYRGNGLNQVPVNLFNIAIYDVLRDHGFIITDLIAERIHETLAKPFQDRPSLLETAMLYCARFTTKYLSEASEQRLAKREYHSRKELITQARSITLENLIKTINPAR